MGMEIVKGDLDPTSCALIRDIYSKDMEHLDKLKRHLDYVKNGYSLCLLIS